MLNPNLASVLLQQLQNSGGESTRAAVPQASQIFPQLSVGQAVTATIITRLSENLFLADIDGRQLQLNLPTAVAPGDAISLRLLRTDPQLVFQLLARSPASPGSAAALAASAAPAQPAGQLIVAEVLDPATAPAEDAPASRATPSLAQLSLGQTVTGTILARIGPDAVLADVDGQRLRLPLPATLAEGESVTLRVLRLEPQPAFEIVPAMTPAPHSLASLSQGAQIIQTILGDARGLQAAPPSPQNAAPLLAAAPAAGMPTQPEQLATALRNAVTASGVFYESHLAAWAQGQRPLETLQREPQAEWRAPATNIGTNAGKNTGANPAASQVASQVASEHGSAPRSLLADLPEQAPVMLRQQIDTLETSRFVWQGPVWPNQTASLTIAEEAPQRGDAEEIPAWRTKLALDLPHLGGIRAELVARGSTLSISIACSDAASAQILDSQLQGLAGGLRAAGLEPLALMVTGHA